MSWGEPRVPAPIDEDRVREIVREEFDAEMGRAKNVMQAFAVNTVIRHHFESLFPPEFPPEEAP